LKTISAGSAKAVRARAYICKTTKQTCQLLR
jgi:hypothetical protein